jgi:hypothetical protein
MPLLSNFRKFLYQRAVRKYKSTNLEQVPDRHFVNIKSVGIVFDANEAKDREAVMAYVERLQNSGMEVWPFGFFDTKIVGVTFPFDFIDVTHLSFAQLPKGDRIREFIQAPFDVLINLDNLLYPPINYICAASQALFKIGPAHGNPDHYDLMIETHEKSLNKYIEEIRKTFKKISG